MGEFPASERTMIRQKAKVPPILNAVKLKIAEQFQDSDKIDRWVHAENLGSILSLVYFDSWSWQSFVSTCDVFNQSIKIALRAWPTREHGEKSQKQLSSLPVAADWIFASEISLKSKC